ncbi:MAG TPA: LysR family transcriptional regulator [Thermoleophilaceae bacterium]|jgi:DNA-binding transcriptional LysR family regulator|nr:LysR family transcriptional regulator [Thermoleophilaceae bacterium]
MTSYRRMAYWLAVVEEGSFSRAAARMHVSQPSLSQQVRALEGEVGGPLLERLPRSVRLTAAGKAFLPHAQTAVRAAERATRAARGAIQLETGELEMSTVRSIAAGILPDVIQTWRERYPGTFVRLHEFTHRRLSEDSVRDGLSDLGIGPPPGRWSGPVCRLGWEEFLVVLPPQDPLTSEEKLALAALAERDWVMFEPGNGLYDLIVTACASAGFRPRHAVLTSQVETAARLAAAGVGPTLVPENVIPDGLDGALLPVDPPLGRELTVYARDEWGPLGGAFVDLIGETPWPKPPAGALVIP